MRNVDIPAALRSASHAAALLRGEGLAGTLKPDDATPQALRDLIAAIHNLTDCRYVDDLSLCPNCDGNGYTTHDELTDHHKREYRTVNTDCKQCDKTGRVLITTLTWQKPFTV